MFYYLLNRYLGRLFIINQCNVIFNFTVVMGKPLHIDCNLIYPFNFIFHLIINSSFYNFLIGY